MMYTMKKRYAIIFSILLAVVAIGLVPTAALAAPNCGGDVGCWIRYAQQQGLNGGGYNPQGAFNEPQAVPAMVPATIVSDPTLTEGQAGTAKLCSEFLVGNDGCVILSAAEASAKVQGLVDLANQEAKVNADCNPGAYGDLSQCNNSAIPPPTITYDSQGRIVHVACGNGGATAEVTYYEAVPAVSPPAGPACSDRQGNACTAMNSCNMTASGTTLCDGSCSAVAPSDALCQADAVNVDPNGGGAGGGGGGGGAGVNGAVGADAVGSPAVPAPVNLSTRLFAEPVSIAYGLSSTLSWSSTGAQSCTGSPIDFAKGATDNAAGVKVSPVVSTLYILTCIGKGGESVYDSRNVTVVAPDISITASPAMVRAGNTSVIAWSIQGKADSCRISGPGLESTDLTGSVPKVINTTSTYTIACTTGALHPTQSVTVEVIPAFREI